MKGPRVNKAALTAVECAVALVSAKKAELASAEKAVENIRADLSHARAAERGARVDADLLLPQCWFVQMRWGGKQEGDPRPATILRKTPSGILMARPTGSDGDGIKFKGCDGVFRQARGKFTSNDRWIELRDVPAEYLPTQPQGAKSE